MNFILIFNEENTKNKKKERNNLFLPFLSIKACE